MMMTSSRGGQQEGTSRLDRKTIEKNRRMHMKGLCFKLATILPKEKGGVPREALTQLDYLDQATCYIKHLQGKLDALKERRGKRELPVAPATPSTSSSSIGGPGPLAATAAAQTPVKQLPFVEVRDLGSSLETVLICSTAASNTSEPDSTAAAGFMFYNVVAALEEEGAHVLNASYSMVNTKKIYTIHSQIPLPRVGTEAARVAEKLKKLLAC